MTFKNGVRTIVLLWMSAILSCSQQVEVKQLILSITSDAPADGASLDTVRILFHSAESRFPESVEDERFNLLVGPGTGPVGQALRVAIDSSGATFGTETVRFEVMGIGNGAVLTRYEGELALDGVAIVAIHMVKVASACDVDGDLFLDCEQSGCCAEGDSQFADCHPELAEANPWSDEPVCEPCDDTIDQNCDGVDVVCVDKDQDGVADCLELECGVDNPSVGPGLIEVCDAVDNNCDGEIDEGFLYGQKNGNLSVGEACGLGICAGVVACKSDSEVTCAYTVGPVDEVCGDQLDNDCDGVPDNGCDKIDVDGDGYPEDVDCNDFDSATNPKAVESCCAAVLKGNPSAVSLCDRNCDQELVFCDPEDGDGDGYWGEDDCDPNKASVHVGAPEKCGDGIDQDCFGGDLPCEGLVDADGDQWPASVDCDDESADTHPQAAELCDGLDNDCDGIVDEGNPYNPATTPCTIDKVVGACKPGKEACDHSTGDAQVICFGEVLAATEICDAVDNDCNGATDEGFEWQGESIGQVCVGLGQCGIGQVECAPGGSSATCGTMPGGSKSQASLEVCDGLDNDCDGELNEGLNTLKDSTCSTQGLCGEPEATVSATCNQDETGTWDCNYDGVPGFQFGKESKCDGLDNNCDGFVDESFSAGKGCDGDDADSCANGILTCAPDGLSAFCKEGTSDGGELCDGLDNDCDGQTDEDFSDLKKTCDGSDTDECMNGIWQCKPDGSGLTCVESVENIPELCDGLDNDCDGLADEDFGQLGEVCDGADQDLCESGTYTCDQQATGVWCVNEVTSANTDICNGLDDDCDGQTDEDSGTQTCGEGECFKEIELCLDGMPQVCQPKEGALPELCDGLDNDCDGKVDEELGVLTCGEGECFQELNTCQDGLLQVCDPLAGAENEICDDGLDNDCDGFVDDGCPGSDCPVGFQIIADDICESVDDDDMVYVPAGSFTMGCPVVFEEAAPPEASGSCEALGGYASANPAHNVILDGFSVDRYEVTVGEYTACIDTGKCEEPSITDADNCKTWKATYNMENNALLPMNFVDYKRVNNFCAWEGKRLCTEAEWEKAARGTGTALYPWGYEIPQAPACDLANFKGCGQQAVNVGSVPDGMSPYGAFDMAGNLNEWTADKFGKDYYQASPEENPMGPKTGNTYVGRGGAFGNSDYDVRVYRRWNYPASRSCHYLGFRCCKDAP
jgi:formylglycine-generating enzyme required for sulfatase activity